MKTTKIVYLIATLAFCALFGTTGTLYLIHHPTMVKKFLELGYPLYTLDIIGTAKLIGVITLAIPKFPRLKEWAYAGFFIDFVAGFWSHAAVQGLHGAIPLLVPTILLVISYATFRKLQAASAAAAFTAATNH
jgi:DoxX-like family